MITERFHVWHGQKDISSDSVLMFYVGFFVRNRIFLQRNPVPVTVFKVLEINIYTRIIYGTGK